MDTSPFSSNVAQNIFKYLYVKKRLQISILCPELRAAERKADLKLRTLFINENDLSIDRMTFIVQKNEEGEDGTFMQIGEGHSPDNQKIFAVSGHKNFVKKMFDLYLADRGNVKVDRLSCYKHNQITEYLPEGLKMECRSLYTVNGGIESLQTIRPFIHLPVGQVQIFVYDPEDPILEDEVVRTATELRIKTDSDESLLTDLLKLRNSSIAIEHLTSESPFTVKDVLAVVADWLIRCPPVDTFFFWDSDDVEVMDDLMDVLRNNLGAVSKSGWPDSRRNYAVLRMRSGNWLEIEAVDYDTIIMMVMEKNRYRSN